MSSPRDPDDTVVLPVAPQTAHAPTPDAPPERAATGSVPKTGAVPKAGSVAKNSAVMAAGSIVSRLTGFLRTAAIGAAIGAGLVADDYNLAITLPNMVFELLVGGVLSSVIVPTLVRARKRDADGGQAYAQRLLTLAVLGLAIATALAVASAPLFSRALAGDSATAADRDLITRLGYLILPAIFFYGMASLCGALLNSRGHFAAPMWTPILNNVVVIATAGIFIAISTGAPRVESVTTTQLLVLGLGTLTGVVVQATGLVPALRRVGFRWRWRFDFRALGLGELGRLAAWMLLYVVVSQIGLFVVLNVAKRVGTTGAASVTIFQYSFLIFMMAHGIVAVSVMTALMPRMSAAAADGRHADLVAQLNSGTRLVAVVLVPIAAAYLTLGRPLAVTLFEWGNYTHAKALATGPVIAVAGLCLLPYAVMQLQQFAFYALRDTRSPALINIPVVALRVVAAITFYLVLPATAVAAALMGGSALSFVVGTLLSIAYLRRRLGLLGLKRVALTLVKLVGAAALAAVASLVIGYAVTGAMGDGKLASAVHLAAAGTALVVVYVAAALMLRVTEMRELTAMVRSKLGR
jgi:putative peptidoglycan lipid II flippase